ncbi:MAG: hypothetical protein AAB263_08770, partial [Planctomycetota bacterium]
IWIKGGANYQLRNVSAAVDLANTTNYALSIEGPAQQVEIYNCAFTSGNQATSKQAIGIYGSAGTSAGNIFIYDSVILNHGILDSGSPGSGFGGMVLVNVLHEAVMSATVQVDSTSSSGNRWTFIGGGQADLAAATAKPLWEHIAGNFPVSDLTFIGVEEPNGIGYYVDNQGTAARITNVTIVGMQNGGTLRPPNSRMRSANLPLAGWSSSILTATPSETLGTGLIGGQLNVGMQFPENVVATGFTTGGTLAAGNFYYIVSALNGINSPYDNAIISSGTPYESWTSVEVTCNVASGTTGRCNLTWNAVPGATSYRIYGRGAYTTNNGQHNKAIYFTSTTTSFSDTGGAGTAGNPPRWDRESGNAPVIRLSGNPDANGNFSLLPFTIGTLNNIRFVDGLKCAKTSAGISAAVTDLGGAGTVVLAPGDYTIDANIPISGTGVSLVGLGGLYSARLNVSIVGDVFSVSGQLFELRNAEIVITAATTRTGSIVNATASQGRVSNVRLTGKANASGFTNNGKIFTHDVSTAGSWLYSDIRIPGGVTWTYLFHGQASTGTLASTHMTGIIGSNTIVWSDAGIILNTGVDTFTMFNSEGNFRVRCEDTLVGQDPRWIRFIGTFIEGSEDGGATRANTAVTLTAVKDFRYLGGYIATAQRGVDAGVNVIGAEFQTEFVNISREAVNISNSGAVGVRVHDSTLEDTAIETTNTYDSISVAANTTGFSVNENMFRDT